jgi:hypothetical protein
MLFLLIATYAVVCLPVTATAFIGPTDPPSGPGDPSGPNDPEEAEPEFDEIAVFVNVQGVGSFEMPAVIKGEAVFLPVTDLFNYLRIKNVAGPGLDSITGFYIREQSTFLIDYVHSRIEYEGKAYNLSDGALRRTETNLYLRADYFGRIFGLDCKFNFRALSVIISTSQELPIIRELRMEQMRANANKLKGIVTVDTVYEREMKKYHAGTMDWSLVTVEEVGKKASARLNMGFGGVVLGGEASLYINYNSNDKLQEKQQYYMWRYVNNAHLLVKQVMLGKVNARLTSTIYDPVIGVQVTNTPSVFRRSFGTYTLSNVTQPGWTVELYVNNVMVDYIKADASGFFRFDVPLVYGNSNIKLRYYGPWGEIRTTEQNINIPFNFVRQNDLEYIVTAGVIEDSSLTRFSRAQLNYGLSRRMTVGTGAEYLSSFRNTNESTNTTFPGAVMPFVNASARLASNLMLYGEYTHGVRSKGILFYRTKSDFQAELNYTKYKDGQQAINTTALEQRRAVLTIPIRTRKVAMFSRFTIDQLILPGSEYTTGEWMLSGAFLGVGTNLSTYVVRTGTADPYYYSNLSVALRLPKALLLTPMVQYEYNGGKIISSKLMLERPVLKYGYVNLTVEQNFRTNSTNFLAGLRYDFSWGQMGATSFKTNDVVAFQQSGRGSVIYDKPTKTLATINRPVVGRGGLAFLAYLDLNSNGTRDEGEPKVPGLKVRVSAGRLLPDNGDSITRMVDMEPYVSYTVELDRNSFDNIGWQIGKRALSIPVEANLVRLIEIPVSVVAEISGIVYQKAEKGTYGQGKIKVNIYDGETLVAQTLTESDGYYNYSGLKPGNYTVRIDAAQLERIHRTATPESLPLIIHETTEGDVVDDLQFTLMKTEE